MTKSMRDEYDFNQVRTNHYPSRLKERHLEFTAWQIEEIKQAMKEADAGEFVPIECLAKATKKYRG